MGHTVVAVVFAAASSITIACGTVVRHHVAATVTVKSPRNTASATVAVIRSRRWWAGTLLALVGYALQLAALFYGTLLIVQPILVLSLVFTMVLAAIVHGTPLARADIWWAGVLSTAVVCLVTVGHPTPGSQHPAELRWAVALSIGMVVLAGLDRVAHVKLTSQRAVILGVVTGGIYGYVALLAKAVTSTASSDGLAAVVTHWQVWALVAGAIIGTMVQQSSFHNGQINDSLPAMTVTEPIVAFALGYLVLGEQFSTGGFRWVIVLAALVAMVWSTVALSQRSQQHSQTRREHRRREAATVTGAYT